MNIVTRVARLEQPISYPTGEYNRRQALCQDCRRILPRGTGRQWDCTCSYSRYHAYLCESCNEHRLALMAIEPDAKAAFSRIEEWARKNVNLGHGWDAADRIKSMVRRRCDLAAADVAHEIADRLPFLKDTGYSTVIDLAEQVIRLFGDVS